jgi:protein DJ-1
VTDWAPVKSAVAAGSGSDGCSAPRDAFAAGVLVTGVAASPDTRAGTLEAGSFGAAALETGGFGPPQQHTRQVAPTHHFRERMTAAYRVCIKMRSRKLAWYTPGMLSPTSTQKTALVILAEGAEEMEVAITVDVLRRADIAVTLAGLDGPDPVTCSRQLRIIPDCALSTVTEPFDLVLLPGGLAGSERLAESSVVGELLRRQAQRSGLIAAICAAPLALAAHGIAHGKTITCHPSVKDRLTATYTVIDTPVVADESNVITSRGPGTAFVFALVLIERLCGAAVAEQVRAPLVFNDGQSTH